MCSKLHKPEVERIYGKNRNTHSELAQKYAAHYTVYIFAI